MVFSGPSAFAPDTGKFSDVLRRYSLRNWRTNCGIEALNVRQELVRDTVLLVQLDGALENLVGEGVSLGKVFGGDLSPGAR